MPGGRANADRVSTEAGCLRSLNKLSKSGPQCSDPRLQSTLCYVKKNGGGIAIHWPLNECCFCKMEDSGAFLFSTSSTSMFLDIFLMDYSASSKDMLEDAMKFPIRQLGSGSLPMNLFLPSLHHHHTNFRDKILLYKIYHSDCFAASVNLVPSLPKS